MRIAFFILLFTGSYFEGLSNNIDVHNAVVAEVNEAYGTRTVRFDVSWSNSWRVGLPIENYDAAWVFMKYRVGTGDWAHATLTTAGVADASFSTFTVSPDGVGAMLYRSQEGDGDVSHDGITLTWDYGADGVADDAEVTMEVFAIEMVYVPEDSYYLGSGGGATREFYGVNLSGNFDYRVTSEGPIGMGLLGPLNYDVPLFGGAVLTDIPGNFPKGYDPFYCMKYEVSQRQYASFYNSATAAQRSVLVLDGMGTREPETAFTRNGLAILPDGTAETMAPNVPVNWISPTQILAFLDWSGLRPMSELEFEKACRGSKDPVPNEYAWGESTVCTTPFSLVNAYSESEAVTGIDSAAADAGGGIYVGNSTADGPLRSGIFAGSFTTRKGTGGSYYGIMELSGNLSEYTVSATSTTGRLYTGVHGDGNLTAAGEANETLWPTATAGYGTRGGAFSLPTSAMEVSDRTYALTTFYPSEEVGFRGVRTSFTE